MPRGRAATPGTTPHPSIRRLPWAELLKRVFAIDALTCPWCGGPRKLIALLTDGLVVRKSLEHTGITCLVQADSLMTGWLSHVVLGVVLIVQGAIQHQRVRATTRQDATPNTLPLAAGHRRWSSVSRKRRRAVVP